MQPSPYLVYYPKICTRCHFIETNVTKSYEKSYIKQKINFKALAELRNLGISIELFALNIPGVIAIVSKAPINLQL